MVEQKPLLEEMLSRAEVSVKELSEKLVELESRQDSVRLEGAVLETVLKLGASWLGVILSAWATSVAKTVGTRRECSCGGKSRWVSVRTKTILTLLGRVSYRRVYYHCQQCKHGEALGDRVWGLLKTRMCKQMNNLELTQVASWWKALTVGLPAELALVAPQARTNEPSQPGAKGPTRLYIAMDGILARLRGGWNLRSIRGGAKGCDTWREVKVGAVFWAEPGRHASKAGSALQAMLAELVGSVRARLGPSVRVWVDRPQGVMSYVAGLLPAASFGVRLYAEAVVRGLEQATEAVVLGDGTLWIWNLAAEHFPRATEILDFHHAKEWVWDVAHAVWGESGPKAKEWAEAQIEEHLLLGDAEGLSKAIACLPNIAPPDGQSKSLSERAIEYFQNNAKRMHYPEYRARGLEIGSGIAESSGRRVVGVRCKQPGMRWSEEGLTAIVDLRARVLSNRYDSTIADMPMAA